MSHLMPMHEMFIATVAATPIGVSPLFLIYGLASACYRRATAIRMHATDHDPEHLYAEHFPLLVELAVARSLPMPEAQDLAHEVLVASLLDMPRIENPATWLRGMLKSAIAHRRREG